MSMKAICPHSLRGQCGIEDCEHYRLHDPVKTSGFTCTSATGICELASDRYRGRIVEVECIFITNERIEEFRKGIEL